jgi:hypothetical protein
MKLSIVIFKTCLLTRRRERLTKRFGNDIIKNTNRKLRSKKRRMMRESKNTLKIEAVGHKAKLISYGTRGKTFMFLHKKEVARGLNYLNM